MTDEQTGQEVVVVQEPRSLLSAIVQMARDPTVNVATLDALMQMQERMELRAAERAFNESLARLSQQMPRVKKNGRVELGQGRGSYPFAKWEDIDRIIRPLMGEEGFTLSFNSEPRQADGGGLIVHGTLLHRDGHSRTASMPLALDSGPGRNNLQAMGSTLSYGKRYCADMLLNIVREGQDDDGVASGAEPISAEECDELLRGLTATNFPLNSFLNFMNAESVQDIQKKNLTMARNAIEARRRKRAEPKT